MEKLIGYSTSEEVDNKINELIDENAKLVEGRKADLYFAKLDQERIEKLEKAVKYLSGRSNYDSDKINELLK